MRADKRLKKIKKRFQEAGVYTRDDCKKLVAQDYKEAQNIQVGGAEDDDTL